MIGYGNVIEALLVDARHKEPSDFFTNRRGEATAELDANMKSFSSISSSHMSRAFNSGGESAYNGDYILIKFNVSLNSKSYCECPGNFLALMDQKQIETLEDKLGVENSLQGLKLQRLGVITNQ